MCPFDRDIFNASVESFDDDTRTSLTAGLDVAWSEGDQLTIFRGNHLGDKYQIMNEYAGKPYGDFELVEENSTGDNFSSGTELPANVAIYPYSENLAIAKNVEDDYYSYTISGVEFPAQQNYVQNSFAEESFIMTAVTESLSDHKLKFKNVGCSIKLQLKGTGTIKAMSIKCNKNENLAGTADVTVSAESTPAFAFTSATKEVILDCGTNGVELNSDEITNFIISLPAVNFTTGFTVTVTDVNGNTEEISTSNHNDVRRSSVLRMPEKNIAFEVETPEEPTVPQMYYGYIPYIKGVSPTGYDKITGDYILQCVDDGTITKVDQATTMGKTSFGVVPKYSLLLIVVPSDSGLVATKYDGVGNYVPFGLSPKSNGEIKITIDGYSYDLYGEYQSTDLSNNKDFKIN